MTSPGLRPGVRPGAAARFQQTRHWLAYVRQPEQLLAGRHSFRRQVTVWTYERLQRWAIDIEVAEPRSIFPRHLLA